MKIVKNIEEFKNITTEWRNNGDKIILVPTMGYFHKGHELLMSFGRQMGDKLIVSLFVNPSQFGPNEDLDSYPRNLEEDIEIAKIYGVDILFVPEANDMYLGDHKTWLNVEELSTVMCGISRPTHFRGVCTVVLKLLMLSQATSVIFGQKDWQQLTIIKRMVKDLNIPVEVLACPIMRDNDGLALSSRNAYLTEDERKRAPHLYKGLVEAQEAVLSANITNTKTLDEIIRSYWSKHLPVGRVDYLEFVHPETLEKISEINGPCLVATAFYLGTPRLIDNLLLKAY